ncbi:MAG: hypothetical protein HN356_03450 [Calditrichaeota bacterium]|jgi:hypothetical protein|nr:hypothetical protein [Calditrichota bacterium]MBT7615657.1 hypothetical protein [Calditrichota bacterium]MBT7788427.1 hypothetical protein [Calditrichota bacterium]
MRRTIFCYIILTVLVFAIPALAAKEENVLSYYAVENTLDGQIIIEQINILRFYPVFWMRQDVDSVRVTIYYGNNYYTRDAIGREDQRFWEVNLPEFKLGEAIQRIEVEVEFNLRNFISKEKVRKKVLHERILDIKSEKQLEELRRVADFYEDYGGFEEYLDALVLISTTAFADSQVNKYLHAELTYMVKSIDDDYVFDDAQEDLILRIEGNLNDIFSNQETDENEISQLNVFMKDSRLHKGILLTHSEIDSVLKLTPSVENVKGLFNRIFDQIYITKFQNDQIENQIETIINRPAIESDPFFDDLSARLSINFSDTSYTGVSVRKCDLIINEDFRTARILYRNYNEGLRRMPALDPAEKSGIFRVRYVPFPVTSIMGNSSDLKLIPFSGDNAHVVFEFGINFGDLVVPGDQFVAAEFSIRRLGLSFAVTEELFDPDAEIKALLFTYEFNSYSSIGAGWNFAGGNVTPYFSWGINQRVFKAMLSNIGDVFK